MRRELAELKIEALLHDPPGKAAILWYRSHERVAAELIEAVLGRAPAQPDVVSLADRYASAVDRAVMPKDYTLSRVDFLGQPEIVHPVAGTRYELEHLRGLDLNTVQAAQRDAVERIVQAAGGASGDPERLYWYLWRGLPVAVEQAGALGKLWRYLPADTRVPDHAIWDHMRLTSAFAGALPEPALLVFSFGPVQSFIEAARRTSDLWAGSFVLSWLAWCAMQPIVVELGADAVLFPDLHSQPLVDRWLEDERGWSGIAGIRGPSRVASLPNRFLALLPAADGERLAREVEAALHAGAREFAELGIEKLEESMRPRADARWRDRAHRQCAMTFSAQWHVLPWRVTAGEGGRSFTGEHELEALTGAVLGDAAAMFWQTRRELAGREQYRPNLGTFFEPHSRLVEAGHGAAKVTRRFIQIEETGERCHVCGLRETLWAKGRAGGRHGPPRTRDGELLCALCWARRWAPRSAWAHQHAGRDIVFPSTHNLAAARFFEDVLTRLARVGDDGGDAADSAVAAAVKEFVAATAGADLAYATQFLMDRAATCGRLADPARDFVKTPAELLDTAVYQERSVAEGSLEELGLPASAANRAGTALRGLLSACRGAGVDPPGTYYAVLVMDGDRMGQWLSGEKAPTIREVLHTAAGKVEGDWANRRRPLSSAHQVAVSRALNQFALEIVPAVVERVHGGVVVYAGGDDVLAMMPLHAVLPCLDDLRRLYSGVELDDDSLAKRAGWSSGGGHARFGERLFQVMGERATASAGVAIAHQKWPLRHALESAREMERLAKRTGDRNAARETEQLSTRARDRNAVALALLKRSGSHEHVAVRWGEGDGVGPFHPLKILDQIRRLIAEAGVSRRFAYVLRDEAPVLWSFKDALAERALWPIQHHRDRKRSEAPGLPDAKVVAEGVRELAEALDRWSAAPPHGVAGPRDDGSTSAHERAVAQFRAALGVAEFLGRGGRE